MARVDYDKMAERYDRGRALPTAGLSAWHEALAPHLSGAGRIVDLGAGTGRFAGLLAEWFGVRVAAVEPSAGMRREAAAKCQLGVDVVGGAAEAIPLRDGAVEAAFLSNVTHHFDDLPLGGRELRRVVRDGSPVLIRAVFPDSLDGVTLFRFFPEARAVAETYPDFETTVAAFTGAGFALESRTSVPQVTGPDLASLVDKVRTKADSTLEPLPEEVFQRGLAALEDEASRAIGEEVVDHHDLLVLR